MIGKPKGMAKNEIILSVFGILLAGMGWGAAGYVINGPWQGLWMGLASVLVVTFCMVNINKG